MWLNQSQTIRWRISGSTTLGLNFKGLLHHQFFIQGSRVEDSQYVVMFLKPEHITFLQNCIYISHITHQEWSAQLSELWKCADSLVSVCASHNISLSCHHDCNVCSSKLLMVVYKSYGYCDSWEYTSYNPLMFWMQSFCFVYTAPAAHVAFLSCTTAYAVLGFLFLV